MLPKGIDLEVIMTHIIVEVYFIASRFLVGDVKIGAIQGMIIFEDEQLTKKDTKDFLG